jgi:hypothetical protein
MMHFKLKFPVFMILIQLTLLESKKFMDVKDAPADIDEMVCKCTPLTNNERKDLKIQTFVRWHSWYMGHRAY